MEKINFENEKDWLAYRKDHIGASDAPVIMGASKWKLDDGRIKTPRLLWQEKLGLLDTTINNAAVNYGKNMEAPAREVYQSLMGDTFEAVVVINKKYPHLMASLDGLNPKGTRAVEIKNANAEDHETAKQGKVPDKYYPQVMQQYLVSEIDYIDYFSFHKGENVRVPVKKDEKYLKLLEKNLKAFWDCVVNLQEPELTENDFIERDKTWKEVANQLWEVKQKKKVLAVEEELLENMLKDCSEGQNSCGGGFRYTLSNGLGRVNYKAITELENVNLDKYRGKPVQSWRLKKVAE